MTAASIIRERDQRLDVARDWLLRAKLGEFTDGQLMTRADVAVFVKQARHLQWNALHLYRRQMRQFLFAGRSDES